MTVFLIEKCMLLYYFGLNSIPDASPKLGSIQDSVENQRVFQMQGWGALTPSYKINMNIFIKYRDIMLSGWVIRITNTY